MNWELKLVQLKMGGFIMKSSRRRFIQQALASTAGLSLLSFSDELLAREDLVRLSILHTNDIHCHIDPFPVDHKFYKGRGGMARLAALVSHLRTENPNSLLFDAGDMFQGTPYFNFHKGKLILKVMSEIGYDASTLGNHEFDNGIDGILNPMAHSKFPFICSNYDFSQTKLYGKFLKNIIFRKAGVRVGVYGLGIKLDGLVSVENYEGTKYNDPVEVALEQESFLKNEKKCDLVICLSHLGFKYKDKRISDHIIAAETHLTDLIIGGHTHTFLDAPVEVENASGKKVFINQSGWGGMMLGKLDFIFDKNKKENPVILTQNISTGQ